MATKKSYSSRNGYRFLQTDQAPLSQESTAFEFSETDIYADAYGLPEGRRQAAIRSSRKHVQTTTSAASSMPVSVPDWSKILKEEYREMRRRPADVDEMNFDYDDEDDADEPRVPPHEFLARQMEKARVGMMSFSVHEGIGRTLKGRDLSRVRNAIWQKTGFED